MTDREAYVQKLHAKIDEWNADIDRLAAKIDQVEADQRMAYQRQIDALREKRQAVVKEADRLRDSGASAWEDLKEGIERARESLETAVKTAKSRFP